MDTPSFSRCPFACCTHTPRSHTLPAHAQKAHVPYHTTGQASTQFRWSLLISSASNHPDHPRLPVIAIDAHAHSHATCSSEMTYSPALFVLILLPTDHDAAHLGPSPALPGGGSLLASLPASCCHSQRPASPGEHSRTFRVLVGLGWRRRGVRPSQRQWRCQQGQQGPGPGRI